MKIKYFNVLESGEEMVLFEDKIVPIDLHQRITSELDGMVVSKLAFLLRWIYGIFFSLKSHVGEKDLIIDLLLDEIHASLDVANEDIDILFRCAIKKSGSLLSILNGMKVANEITGWLYNHSDVVRVSKNQYRVWLPKEWSKQNRRIGKKINGALVKRWIYSGQLSPVAELDSAGNVIAQFAGGYMVKGSNTYQLITDHLGSVRMVVNVASGEIVERTDYDEFGNVTQNTNPDFQPFAYASGLYDTQTKLVRFGARDYNASVGRWTSKDPIGFGGGSTSLYTYVKNNATNKVDLLGWYECSYSISQHRMVCTPNQIPHAGFESSNYVSGNNNLLGPENYGGNLQNNPDYTNVPYYGPIPVGDYIIGNQREGSSRRDLIPSPLNNMYGRSDFQTHGCGNAATCSAGCVAATSNGTRDRFNSLMSLEEGNNTLHVVP